MVQPKSFVINQKREIRFLMKNDSSLAVDYVLRVCIERQHTTFWKFYCETFYLFMAFGKILHLNAVKQNYFSY